MSFDQEGKLPYSKFLEKPRSNPNRNALLTDALLLESNIFLLGKNILDVVIKSIFKISYLEMESACCSRFFKNVSANGFIELL